MVYPRRIFDFDKVRDRNAIPYGGLIFDFTTASVEYLLRHIISKFKTAISWLLKELEGQLEVQNDPQVVSF